MGVASVYAALLVETVAVVPAGTVVAPGSRADPAPLVAALAAGHVVAASVLLDSAGALGAFLGVGRDPVGRLGVVFALLDPQLDQRADGGAVGGLAAAKAEGVAAGASDRGDDDLELLVRGVAFDGILAVGGRAPAEDARVVDVGAVEEALVPGRAGEDSVLVAELARVMGS